eukprot:4582481-Amphidinium_carterae.1
MGSAVSLLLALQSPLHLNLPTDLKVFMWCAVCVVDVAGVVVVVIVVAVLSVVVAGLLLLLSSSCSGSSHWDHAGGSL